MTEDPRSKFVRRIDLAKTRVKSSDGFLLVCGGKYDINPTPIYSVRHLIYSELTCGKYTKLASRIYLAEDIQDWFHGNVYKDLVTLEEHLASLSALVLLVVESAGAIAELGAFSTVKSISDRLLVLVAETHWKEKSFIKLGPLNRLGKDSLMVYDWVQFDQANKPIKKFDVIQTAMPEIITAIDGYFDKSPAETSFSKNVPGHVMFLICELCSLFGALNISEIRDYLSVQEIELPDQLLEQYVFLLEKCGMLGLKARGHGEYYYAPSWSPRISFGYTSGDPIDKDRLRIDSVSYYEVKNKTRALVVKSVSDLL